MLGGLGVAGDVERDAEFVEDLTDLVDEVVDDLYVRRFSRAGSPPFSRAEARKIADAAVNNPAAAIEPTGLDEATTAAMRARLALAVREELERRKQRTGVMTYDDQIGRLHAVLAGAGGAAIARRLRERWKVVLVDEFQDTDPVQWDIMRRAFGTGTLVLIGDPKQAIYAFRGADVFAYLEAAREATTQATLEVNWRSDQGLIDAHDALFGGARLGHEGIAYRTVRATDANQTPRLAGAPENAPLRVRIVHRDEPSVRTTPGGYASAPSAREHIARDLAGDLVALLSSAARVDGKAIAPGHVAVLVRTNRTAAQVRDALDAVDVPAVINGAGSVFGTQPARQWLRLLEALERPTSAPRARAAALTPFLGWTAERVATAPEDEWEDVHRRLHGWARLLRVRGVASLAEAITLVESIPARVLAEADGERRLTDLRHVGQLLHAAATTEQLGTTALAQWLRRRVAEAEQDTSDEDRSRRLESDAEAVQVLTIHRSKGLEFPIVYCPDLWEPTWITDDPVPVAFHDPDRGDARVVDVGLEGPEYQAHKRQHLVEQRGEDLRLAYVALTRARHQVVAWWAGSSSSRHSALGRLLFARAADGTVDWRGRSAQTDAAATERFEALAAEAPGCIGVERSRLALPRTLPRALEEPSLLATARFDRRLDLRWRRTSFSDISAGRTRRAWAASPRSRCCPTSRRRPSAPRRRMRATRRCARRRRRSARCPPACGSARSSTGCWRRPTSPPPTSTPSWPGGSPSCRRGGRSTSATRRSPSPACAPRSRRRSAALRLRDLARADRLDELDFELPLAGGDDADR